MTRLLRLLLVAAFLSAQAAGVVHEIWHAAPLGAHAAGDAGVDGKAPKKNPLCDFHTALASVLGAIQGGSPAPDAIASSDTVFIAADVRAARFSALTPQSRGPPALL